MQDHPTAKTRRIRIGEQRYVDTGRGWHKIVTQPSGTNRLYRLTDGEADYVEQRYADEEGDR